MAKYYVKTLQDGIVGFIFFLLMGIICLIPTSFFIYDLWTHNGSSMEEYILFVTVIIFGGATIFCFKMAYTQYKRDMHQEIYGHSKKIKSI